jgi:transposase-like protein
VLDILVQRRRDTTAAKTFCRKLLRGFTDVPRVMVTDKLKSDAAAEQEMLPSVANPARTSRVCAILDEGGRWPHERGITSRETSRTLCRLTPH